MYPDKYVGFDPEGNTLSFKQENLFWYRRNLCHFTEKLPTHAKVPEA